MSSQKWSGKSKRFNPNRNFVMSDSSTTPTRKFNPRSSFQPSGFNPSASFQPGQFAPSPETAAGGFAIAPGAPGVPGAPGAAPTALSPGVVGISAPVAGASPGVSGPSALYGALGAPASSGAAQGVGGPPPSGPAAATAAIAGTGLPAATPVAGNLAAAPAEALAYMSLYHPPLRPLQYHTYAPTPFRKHMRHLEPHERHAEDLFVPQDVRKELSDRNDATLQVLAASNLPEFVHVYHSLVPLDMGAGQKDQRLFGATVQHYKAVSHTTGRTYMLMRVNDFELSSENENSLQVINKWKRVHSGAVVGVVEAFTTFAFVDAVKSRGGSDSAATAAADGSHEQPTTKRPSLVIVYEWWPLAKPLANISDTPLHTLWTIAVQLFGAILAVHRRGLACRGCLNESFVLLNGRDRVRIGSVGALDVLSGGVGPGIGDLQTTDFKDLGAMLRRIAKTRIDEEFEMFVASLEEGNVERSHELLSPHVFTTSDRAFQEVDHLETVLAMELENGRLFRLLAKMQYVLKYPEDADPLSAKYPLVLFMDYVFHQQTEQGTPSLNLAHALAALNKLDAGVEDKVLLTSKDLKTRIVISYVELKQRFTAAFEALRKN